jgi:hypothetical protein
VIPKKIQSRLGLANVWIIYDALRRQREGKNRKNEFPKFSKTKS